MALPGQKGGVSVEFRPMSPEEIERTMQFVLHGQARFEANLASLGQKTDRMADGIVGLTTLGDRVDRRVEEVVGGMAAVRDGLLALTGIVGRMSERVDRVAEAQERTDQQMKETDRQMKDTDQRIKKLGNYFERHLRDDHGGRPS